MANQFVKRLMFAVCAVLVGVAQATTYYVSPSGDDSNAGTSWEGAFKTVNKGFSFVNDHARGSTLVIDSGTYKLTSALAINGGGTENQRGFVTSRTGNPADVVIDGDGKYECLRIGNYIQIQGITFSNGVNRTGCAAGGVRFPTEASTPGEFQAIVSNCIVTCCRNTYSSGNGAAVAIWNNSLLVDSVIRDNTAASWRGGGVLMVNNAADGGVFPVLRRCRIEGNTSHDSGAGVLVTGSSSAVVKVEDCEIVGNVSESNGGGVFCPNDLDLRISGCVISNNAAGGSGGGGGMRIEAGLLSITDSLFAGNTAAANGAGVDLASSPAAITLVCKRTVFRGNVAGVNGGGVRIYSIARAFFDGCRFEGCVANGEYSKNCGGGGLMLAGQDAAHLGYCSVSNCVFASNVAQGRGGGLMCTWNQWFRGAIVNCVFTNNASYAQGGGLAIREDYANAAANDEPAIIRNNLFAFNETMCESGPDSNGGGVYLATRSDLVMENCTIVSNNIRNASTSYKSGGIHHRWNGTLKNCIVAFNTARGQPEGNGDWSTDDGNYVNCCGCPEVTRFTTANGCINADPRFVDPVNGDFRLQPKVSPCIDKGLNVDWMTASHVDAVTGKRVKVRDLAGVPRVYGGIVDIGCYEVWFPKSIAISFH